MTLAFDKRTSSYLKISLTIVVLLVNIRCSFAFDSLRTALKFHQASRLQEALPIFINLSKKFKNIDIANYSLCQLKIADIIRAYGGNNLALDMLNKNERLINSKIEKPSVILAENYLSKAETFYSLSRYDECKRATLNSIHERRKLNLSDKHFVEDYLELSKYYYEIRTQPDSCKYWLMKSFTLARSGRKSFQYLLPKIYNMIGQFLHPLGSDIPTDPDARKKRLTQYETSRAYYDSAISLIEHQPIKDKITLAKVFHNLGNSYSNEIGVNKELHFDKALVNYRKSLELINDFHSPNELGLKYWVIAVLFHRYDLQDSSIAVLNKGIELLVPNFKIKRPNDLPSLQPTLDDNWFASLVRNKAGMYYKKFLQHGKKEDLLDSYNLYIYNLKFYFYHIARIPNERESSFRSYLYSLNSYYDLVDIAHAMYKLTGDINYVKEIYGLLVRCKYAYLNRNDFDPSLSNDIDYTVIDEEQKVVKRNILMSIPSLSEGELAVILPTQLTHSKRKNLAQINITKLILDTTNVEDIQNELQKDKSVLIDFYPKEQYLYTIIIMGKDFKISKKNWSSNFKELVWRFKKLNPSTTPNEYAKLSNSIFKVTLDSALRTLPKENSRLVICPDYFLQNIAWDALVTDTTHNETFVELDYLLKKYTVRTVLSPRHLLNRSENLKGYLGISSDFINSKRFSSIPFSYSMVKKKSNELNGIFSKRFDKNDSVNVAILHLAAHVKNDSLRPYNSSVYFGDQDSITISSISQSKIKINLAILNGCQTGNGTHYQSEGTITLARAFHRKGSISALTTLWDVDDKTSSDVLSNFYDEIESGNELDISLRNAKLKFIANAPTDELANPYYWGGVQLSGANSPIFKEDIYKSVVAWFIGVAVIGVIFNSIRRNKLAKGL